MRPTELRGILHYIPRFREQVFVIALDGAIVADDNFGNLLLDVAVLRSLNIHVVLVHGAGFQVRQLGEQLGQPLRNRDGTGVTDPDTLRIGIIAANQVTHEILEGLSLNNLRAAHPNCIEAVPLGIIRGDRLPANREGAPGGRRSGANAVAGGDRARHPAAGVRWHRPRIASIPTRSPSKSPVNWGR